MRSRAASKLAGLGPPLDPTPERLALARAAFLGLWYARVADLCGGVPARIDLRAEGAAAGSCVFAAATAFGVFGGEFSGNWQHVFIEHERAPGGVVDLSGLHDIPRAWAVRAHADMLRHRGYALRRTRGGYLVRPDGPRGLPALERPAFDAASLFGRNRAHVRTRDFAGALADVGDTALRWAALLRGRLGRT